MSLFWYQPKDQDKPETWECWTADPREENPFGGDKPELIGYVDKLYTTLEKSKFIASMCMEDHPEQQELDTFVLSITEGREWIESQYMAWRMVGTISVKPIDER